MKIFNTLGRDPSGYVYYAKLIKGGRAFYAIGFSKEKTLEAHLASNDEEKGECIDKIFFFTFRDDALKIKRRLFSILKKKICFGKYGDDPNLPLYGGDQRGLFSYDVLGLDTDLYKLSDEAENSQKEAGLGCLFIFIGLVLIPFTAGISLVLIFIVIGVLGIHEHMVNHGKELNEKEPPKLPKKLQQLVSSLASHRRDF